MTAAKFRLHRVERAFEVPLEASQQAVLALGDGEVVAVFGAPLSGKTTVLKAFVVDRVKNRGKSSDSVLAISATRQSATRLRDELALALQSATKGPMARTLASFAFAVVSANALANGQQPPELVSGSEQDRILEALLIELEGKPTPVWPESFGPKTRRLAGFRAELRDLITVAIEMQVTPEKLSSLAGSGQYAIWHQVSEVYQAYLAKLAEFENERLDSAALMHRATDLLATGFWPENLARPETVLVDDSQELTPGATRLLTQLVGESSGLILFGDPDASTLGFRASNSKAMTELVTKLRAGRVKTGTEPALFLKPRLDARVESLSHVLAKSAQKIAPDFAGRHRFSPIESVAKAMATPDAAVSGLEGASFSTDAAEVAWLANRLRQLHLQSGVEWHEMAVVARTRAQLDQLELALANHGVPARIAGSQAALRDEFGARSLLLVARAVLATEPITIEAVLALLQNPFFDINNLELRRLRRSLRAKTAAEEGPRNSDDLLLELFQAPGAFADLKVYELTKLRRFLDRFHGIRAQHAKTPIGIEDLLWQIFNESAPNRDWLAASRGHDAVAAQANRNLDSITALVAAAKRFAERHPSAPATDYVERQLAVGLPEDTLVKDARGIERVPLLTPAGLIGQQFKVVAVAKLIDGIWPNLRARSSLLGATALEATLRGEEPSTDSELPNELRMFYKAVGAATEHFIATVTQTENDVASQFFQLCLGGLPTAQNYPVNQLDLRAMVGQLRRALVSESSEAPFDNPEQNLLALAQLAIAEVPGANPDQWLGILEPSTDEPLYYIEGKDSELVPVSPSQLESFLECPLHWFIKTNGGDDRTFEASLGNLLHAALERSKSDADLAAQVEKLWPELRFESEWLNRSNKRRAMTMVRNLTEYLQGFRASGSTLLGTELQFKFEHGDAVVSGRIDRIERTADGKVMVVDLKTGKTAPSAEEMTQHPQLLTYQLAVEKSETAVEKDKLGEVLGADTELAGARLVVIGGNSLAAPSQAPFDESAEAKAFIESAIQSAAEGMARTTFIAKVGDHCTASRYDQPCEVQIVQAVSHVG